ncbi:MAG TPA: Hsp20/alpha crystallin family protein [Steroidobacteraceae bacterium]|nr:Hsp20/alpha crystallin family protein [Steroidobacteraceae bacterium]
MSLVRWEPLREMEDFFRDYASFFAPSRRRVGGSAGEAAWAPTANIVETDKEYLIKAELPEVKKEDVKITLADGVLTLSGERKLEREDKNANDIRIESFYGSFSRSFALPSNVNAQAVTAEAKDGVLTIHVPKTETSKPKSITIEVK